ncbi:MAG: PIG-L family deacetylase [Patescibacteria group bacterium]
MNNNRQILSLGTILAVWAHPDDETWNSAGLMMAAVTNGQRVVIVTATRGELGSVDTKRWPLATLDKVRETELASALKVIGINEHYWLNYPDGGCSDIESASACNQLKEIFDKVRPDTVITFGPDGLTGHADHKAVGHWARTVASASNPKPTLYEVIESQEKYEKIDQKADKLLNIFFKTASPRMLPEAAMDICFKLPPDLLNKKLTAIAAHVSQYEKLMECLKNGSISSDIAGTECFMKAK